jgi:hypothetical protein
MRADETVPVKLGKQAADRLALQSSECDRDDDYGDDERAVRPPDGTDLVERDARPQQRNAETQDAARREVDAGPCPALDGDRIERHAKEQRIQQRRPSAMIGNERRRDCDDGAQHQARPRLLHRPAPLRDRAGHWTTLRAQHFGPNRLWERPCALMPPAPR